MDSLQTVYTGYRYFNLSLWYALKDSISYAKTRFSYFSNECFSKTKENVQSIFQISARYSIRPIMRKTFLKCFLYPTLILFIIFIAFLLINRAFNLQLRRRFLKENYKAVKIILYIAFSKNLIALVLALLFSEKLQIDLFDQPILGISVEYGWLSIFMIETLLYTFILYTLNTSMQFIFEEKNIPLESSTGIMVAPTIIIFALGCYSIVFSHTLVYLKMISLLTHLFSLFKIINELSKISDVFTFEEILKLKVSTNYTFQGERL